MPKYVVAEALTSALARRGSIYWF